MSERASGRVDEQPDKQPDEQPGGQAGGQPGEHPDEQPGGRPDEQPSARSDGQADAQAGGRPHGQSGGEAGGRPGEKRPGKPGGGKPGARPGGRSAVERRAAHAVQRVTTLTFGRYQSAVVRIGFAGTWLLFLLRELPHRRELYGPDSPWGWDLAEQLIARNGAFTALMWSDSAVWFEVVYGLAVLSSVLLLLGWRTRTMSVFFMFGVLSLQNRSIFMGDGGDNVIHLMAIYLVLTRCGQVWSLDARRAARAARAAARTGAATVVPDRVGPVLWVLSGAFLLVGTVWDGSLPELWLVFLFWGMWIGQGLWWAANRYASDGETRSLLDIVANLVHNAALVVIMAEVCLVYATAGWYKIQGSRWQDGTALYYPLHLDYFSPWPVLSDLLASNALMVLVLTYGTVIVQVAFPFTLFNRRVKNVLLVAMMLEHAGIAVLLGLPFFSLAMIAADAVFLPTNFLRWLGAAVSRLRERCFPQPRPSGRSAPPGQRSDSPDQPRTLVG
ncbi:HTTM domain-containing protein [Streptomyces corynorhini]|uniref:HTTM domain-containing protein n=1 Tax=Streptomyces corynorhini TaxID=2282652 RepID=A0A370B7F1_9ACTN|nr:HTTM domain-containing protein [Streptomyces corynorhini]RDG36319.1 HTTM domain-containing protein [Streptomyces corynorhini]